MTNPVFRITPPGPNSRSRRSSNDLTGQPDRRDLIVVDEAGMLGLTLANKLIKAVRGRICCWAVT